MLFQWVAKCFVLSSSDAHEWINEILSPYLLSSETTAKETGLVESAEKKEPAALDYSPTLRRDIRGVA